MKRQLLIGAGRSQGKRMGVEGETEWEELVTLDCDPRTGADVIHDLDDLPYLHFKDDEFDEIHAYEVLEHCGAQGDWRFFFAQFGEFWRITKPGGLFFATVPSTYSAWVWADPGHRRTITPNTLQFLSRSWADRATATTMASDYRSVMVGDWSIEQSHEDENHFRFAMRALK